MCLKKSILSICLFISVVAQSQVCLKTTVYFKNGKDELKENQLIKIDSLLKTLHPDTTYLIEYHGHSDDRGKESTNMKLSERRVNAVVSVFKKSNHKHITQIPLYFGEMKPESHERALNRRVSIYIRPLNPDGTITIYGENGEEMRTPANFFGGCGICLSNPKLESKKPSKNDTSGYLNVKIVSDCSWDITCNSVEFRFPYSYFNESSEIKMPRPLYVHNCGNTNFSKDSIDLKTDEHFKVRFDTLSNEYIVTHDCFNPYTTICCGTKSVNVRYKVILPASIENKLTYYYSNSGKFSENRKIISQDTIIKELQDSFFVNGSPDFIYGYGFYKGELLFLKENFETLRKKAIYTEKGFYDYTEVKISVFKYAPLIYKDTVVFIKLPRKHKESQPGFNIEGFDYFIPFEKTHNRKYQHDLLDYRFDYSLRKTELDKSVNIAEENLRIHRKKRKAIIKIKVKKGSFE